MAGEGAKDSMTNTEGPKSGGNAGQAGNVLLSR